MCNVLFVKCYVLGLIKKTKLKYNFIDFLFFIPDPWLPSSVGRGLDFWPSQWGLDVAAASSSTRSNDRRSSARLVWRCRSRTTGQRWWPPRGLTCSERSTRQTGLEIVRELPWTRVVLHGKDPRRSQRMPLPCPFLYCLNKRESTVECILSRCKFCTF